MLNYLNQEEINHYLRRIGQNSGSASDIILINEELNQPGNRCMQPQVLYYLGFALWQNGLHEDALSNFSNVIGNEIFFDFVHFNTKFSDSIGITVSFLMDQYKEAFEEDTSDIFQLGYFYLSKSIELGGIEMCDSFKYRAMLSDNYSNHASLLGIKHLNQMSFVPIPLTISDYFFAAQGYAKRNMTTQANECYNRADYLHRFLEDITISGKDADEYSLEEISLIGKERNERIMKSIDDLNFLNANSILVSMQDIYNYNNDD